MHDHKLFVKGDFKFIQSKNSDTAEKQSNP